MYERLAGVTIELPPLRDRRLDISELIEYFLYRYARQDKKIVKFDPESSEALTNYNWPGNVRQLGFFVQRVNLLHGIGWDLPDTTSIPFPHNEDMIYTSYLSMASLAKPLNKAATESQLPRSINGAGNHHTAGSTKSYDPSQTTNETGESNGNGQISVRVEIPQNANDLNKALVAARDMAEREVVSEVLRRTRGNMRKASRILGVSPKTIMNKIVRFGLTNSYR